MEPNALVECANELMRALKAHIWDREDGDWYAEPSWCSQRLFEEETFSGGIYDPACGMCRILSSALAIDPATPSTVYAGTLAGGVFVLMTSSATSTSTSSAPTCRASNLATIVETTDTRG